MGRSVIHFASRSRFYKTHLQVQGVDRPCGFETCFHLRESSRASVAKSQTHVPCEVVYTQVGLHVANVANECLDELADFELLTLYLLKVGLFQDGLRRTLKWNANGRLMQLNLHTCTIAKVDSIH